jgi:hypothetical protein
LFGSSAAPEILSTERLSRCFIGQFVAFTIRGEIRDNEFHWRACCHPTAKSKKLVDFVRNIGADA